VSFEIPKLFYMFGTANQKQITEQWKGEITLRVFFVKGISCYDEKFPSEQLRNFSPPYSSLKKNQNHA